MAEAIRRCPRYARSPGPVAQLVEQGTFNPKVAGSSPARPIKSGDLQPSWVSVVALAVNDCNSPALSGCRSPRHDAVRCSSFSGIFSPSR